YKRLPLTASRSRLKKTVLSRENNLPKFVMGSDSENDSMFIDNIEFRQNPQITGGRTSTQRVSSAIWLQFLDQCECFRMDKVFDSTGISLEGDRVNASGESEPILFAARNCVSLQDGKLENQMVKSGTEIVDNISSHQSPLRIGGPYARSYEFKTLPFKIRFDSQRIVFLSRRIEGIDCRAELQQVVIRAFEFELDTV
ncbi:MAG: hypothetical protein WA002_09780, partial [Candidatus Acidiferrales bacterium]